MTPQKYFSCIRASANTGPACTILAKIITVLIPKNITAVINFITVISLIPLNCKTVTVAVILIDSGSFSRLLF